MFLIPLGLLAWLTVGVHHAADDDSWVPDVAEIQKFNP